MLDASEARQENMGAGPSGKGRRPRKPDSLSAVGSRSGTKNI